MMITQEVRDFAARQNQENDASIAAEDAAAGMAEVSERLREVGSELYRHGRPRARLNGKRSANRTRHCPN